MMRHVGVPASGGGGGRLHRPEAQERALMGGMRGVAFSALLGTVGSRKDHWPALCTCTHLQREIHRMRNKSLSLPRLRPIINNTERSIRCMAESQLCQVICAYRIFLPFVGITGVFQESASFRDGIVKIAAARCLPGVSAVSGIMREVQRQGR